MNIQGVQMLSQLTGQDLSRIEMQLAELNRKRKNLKGRQQQAISRLDQLQQQHLQATRTRSAAGMLAMFNGAIQEMQQHLTLLRDDIIEIEQQQKEAIRQLTAIQRKQQAYDSLLEKSRREEARRDESRTQRKLDDMSATRATSGDPE